MGIVAFDAILFGMMILDIHLHDGLFWSGQVDGVAFAAKFPRIRFHQFLGFGTRDVFVSSAMTTFAGKVTVIALALHRNDGVVATDTTTVSCIMDRKGRNFSH